MDARARSFSSAAVQSRRQGMLLVNELAARSPRPLIVVRLSLWCALLWAIHSYIPHPDSSGHIDVWVSSPIVITLVELCLTFFGRRWMEGREPFKLPEVMIVYDVYQVVLNGWCVIAFISYLREQKLPFWGNSYDDTTRNSNRLSWLIYLHYNNKYMEMCDTLFIVLKKKFTHLSYLHVFQRIVLLWSWFVVCRTNCGGDSYFGAMANAFCQVFTYSYYGM
jgi:elongation of very long chain fatty acids protein 4